MISRPRLRLRRSRPDDARPAREKAPSARRTAATERRNQKVRTGPQVRTDPRLRTDPEVVRARLRLWGLVGMVVAAAVLFSIAVPDAAAHGLPIGLAFAFGLLVCGSGLIAVRAPAWGVVSWAVGQCLYVWFGHVADSAPWPMPVVALLALCQLVIVLGLRSPWRFGATAWALGIVVSLQVVVLPGRGTTPGGLIANVVTSTAITALTLTAALLLAQTAGIRSQLRTEQQVSASEQARRLVVEERNRIARDLHDVVAHSMSIIQIQASSAPYRLEGLDDGARKEFAEIAESARTALKEMRVLLGVLRSDEASPEFAPQPGLDQLGDLTSALTRAGVGVTVERDEDIPAGGVVASTAYRIVQEALSNVIRHAPGASVEVSLRHQSGMLEVVVENGAPTGPRPAASDGRGHGLRGMSERAAAVGGTAFSGPTPGGGFRVSASLPLDTSEPV